ncbi:hypothetical protein AIOL_000383 [Candidatus Rhodobacter oscarellae]|uniref:Uncharacterized protein n=1 Tax=Candidatus Rhodobacter oscarellae TaxID=1675527 RepID=A0A0J9EBS6_9RHOB|nr:hypothetical protein [Candidatus Rhodobacter lobularis]KMW60230.1 hypothetical protein AIOL_000383 [Candidatus Rhodobacter lobularis]
MTQAEDDWQKSELHAPIGLPGSGARRYAAAMYFNRQGRLSDALLEIYRRCYRLDDENPFDLALFEGIEVPDNLAPPEQQ